MSELGVFSTFKNSELGCSLTTLKDSNDDVWFFGNEFESTLKYANPQKAIRDHVDESDKFYFQDLTTGDLTLGLEFRGVNDSFTPCIQPHTIFLSEAGAYCLILQSKLPTAKEFTKWVTKEVLPTIRKTGTYTMPEGALPKLNTITNGEISELRDIERKKFRHESVIKSNLAKDQNRVACGYHGGIEMQRRRKKIIDENEELKTENENLKAELAEITAGLEELAQD